jgi:hypothetical protein
LTNTALIFFIAAEGLNSFFNTFVSVGLYFCYSHQDNFLFEMMIGMKVNFHKILLMGLKVVDFVFVFW